MPETDDLFAEMRLRQVAVPRGLMARVLQDAARLQPGAGLRVVQAGLPAPAGFWAQFSAFFGGAGMLAGMATAAVAGVYLGFAQPGPMPQLTDAWLTDPPLETVDLMPEVETFLNEGQTDD